MVYIAMNPFKYLFVKKRRVTDDLLEQLSKGPASAQEPMLFAPQHDQLVERRYEPAGPAAASLKVWPAARALAEQYWALLAEDARLSDSFRELCGRCLETLRALSVPGLKSSAAPAH